MYIYRLNYKQNPISGNTIVCNRRVFDFVQSLASAEV